MAGSIQRRRARWAAQAGLLTVVLAASGAPTRLGAHEIPASVVVQAFVKPEANRLQVLLRVPLVSMRDFTFPTTGQDMLDLTRLGRLPDDAVTTWLAPGLAFFEDDRPIGAPAVVLTRISLPSDRSFDSFEAALARLRGPPLDPAVSMPVTAAFLDVLLEYPITSAEARFSMDPQLARLGLRVVTVLRFLAPGQAERAFQFAGDPGLVRLDPRWHQAALTFVRFGFDHILDGIDHLLFLLCLVLPLRRLWPLFVVVTSFTAAHSITLLAAAFGVTPSALWFPPLVETLIAASIVYMAIENIVIGARRATPMDGAVAGRWMVAFAFGLVHGFGFSFALQDTLQFAGAHVVSSLLAFNVGVELGQLLVLVVLVPVLSLLFRRVVEERIGVIIASALVLHTAWHWMIDRGGSLAEYDWSITNPAALATILRALMVVVAIGGGFWIWRRRK